MKFEIDHLKVAAAGAGNAFFAFFASLADWQEVAYFILTLGQIAVATVTVFYIVRKLRKK